MAARIRGMRMVPPSPSSISSPTRRRFPTRSSGSSISSSAHSSRSQPMKASDLLVYISLHRGCARRLFSARAAALVGRRQHLRSVCGMDAFRERKRTAGRFSGSPACPGRWRISCADGSSPGRTGSGKTQCAINSITYQVFQNVPYWGGVCLDQKGLYWEILVKMAAHFGRENDLVLLQTRPSRKR